MATTNLGRSFRCQLKIFTLFIFIAYIAYAIGVDLREFIFVYPDGKSPCPNS